MSDQISLEFRPESPSGILLLTGEREDLSGDFLALYIRDGYLEFRLVWKMFPPAPSHLHNGTSLGLHIKFITIGHAIMRCMR